MRKTISALAFGLAVTSPLAANEFTYAVTTDPQTNVEQGEASPVSKTATDAGVPEAAVSTESAAPQKAKTVLQDIRLYPKLAPGMLVKLPSENGPNQNRDTSHGQDSDEVTAGQAGSPAELGTVQLVAPPASREKTDKEQTAVKTPPMFLPAKQVLSPQTAFLTNTMLRDVIRFGTGRRARQLGRADLAGKTGTTNDQQDAWFSGFSSQTVTVTWVGFDNPRPLGEKETGARAALPMWIAYMQQALKGEPETSLVQPIGMVNVRIDADTGLLAGPNSTETLFEYFPADQVPQEKPVRAQTREGGEESSGDITEQLF